MVRRRKKSRLRYVQKEATKQHHGDNEWWTDGQSKIDAIWKTADHVAESYDHLNLQLNYPDANGKAEPAWV